MPIKRTYYHWVDVETTKKIIFDYQKLWYKKTVEIHPATWKYYAIHFKKDPTQKQPDIIVTAYWEKKKNYYKIEKFT